MLLLLQLNYPIKLYTKFIIIMHLSLDNAIFCCFLNRYKANDYNLICLMRELKIKIL